MTAAPLPAGRLRRADPRDAARLALLAQATFLHAFADDHPGDAIVAHLDEVHSRAWYAAALADPARALWLVETPRAAPIGYALLAPGGTPDLYELKRLYVLGPWQGAGWGARLLDTVEREARERGARRLRLCVYAANAGARRFYARQGFADTGVSVDFMVGEAAFVDHVLEKAL